jgi:hypothetical protein
MKFQSDARATNPASVLGFVYSKNLPAFKLLTAGQFTAHDVLRRLHADACTICCMQAPNPGSRARRGGR